VALVTIDTVEKAQELRILRNECAEWMTRDTDPISPEQQEKFFAEKLATGAVDGFLMYADGKAVAYGLLIWGPDGRAWSSTGVKISERGNGYGRTVTIENVKRAHRHGVPMWAEVRCDNAGQQRICHTIGYETVDTFHRDGLDIDVMRCDEVVEP
jgi:hypothetical protein